MIEWLKSWTNSIIISVIITVIFELIIPNSNNKKYIKMVLNLYVLFVILNPLIIRFTNFDSKDLTDINYNKYFKSSEIISTNAKLDTDTLVNTTAEKTIKENIKSKLKVEGYNVLNISININNESGQIEHIYLKIKKIENEISKEEQNIINNNIDIKIENIENIENVNISNENNNKKYNFKKSEIKRIKEILETEYEISKENIEIY